MTQPFLYLRHRSTAHGDAIVVKDIDRQEVQVGSPFGVGERTAAPLTRAFNRVAHWNNDLYCILEDRIWKYDVANSGDWGVFYDFSANAIATYTEQRLGLYPVSVNGSGFLATGYPTASDSMRFITIDRAGNVSESATKTFPNLNVDTNDNRPFGPAVAWRNKLVWITDDGTPQLSIYDFETETASQTAGFDVGTTCVPNYTNPVVFNDKVWIGISENSFRNPFYIARLDGNVLTRLNRVDASPDIEWEGDSGGARKMGMLCEVTGCLYVVWETTNPGSSFDWFFRAHQIQIDRITNTVSSITPVDNTLPDEIRDSGIFEGLQTGDPAQSVFIRVDNKTNPGSPIYEIDFFNADDEGQTRRLYRWNGDMNTKWTFVDAGLDAYRYDFICATEGTSERIWTGSGTINATIPELTLGTTSIIAKFRIYGGQSGVSAQILYDKEGETLREIGTILSISSGSHDGTTASGLVADGTTEYELEWGASIDGITTGDNPKVAIRVFV